MNKFGRQKLNVKICRVIEFCTFQCCGFGINSYLSNSYFSFAPVTWLVPLRKVLNHVDIWQYSSNIRIQNWISSRCMYVGMVESILRIIFDWRACLWQTGYGADTMAVTNLIGVCCYYLQCDDYCSRHQKSEDMTVKINVFYSLPLFRTLLKGYPAIFGQDFCHTDVVYLHPLPDVIQGICFLQDYSVPSGKDHYYP